MGSGMPWHIILVFFAIGLIMGINAAKPRKKRTIL